MVEKIGNDNCFVAVVTETDTGEVMNSMKSGMNIFRFLFGLNIRGVGFEVEIQRYTVK